MAIALWVIEFTVLIVTDQDNQLQVEQQSDDKPECFQDNQLQVEQ